MINQETVSSDRIEARDLISLAILSSLLIGLILCGGELMMKRGKITAHLCAAKDKKRDYF